jgi:hypothetical protein
VAVQAVEVMARAVEAQGLAAEAQVAEAQVQAVVCRDQDPAQALGQVRGRAQARAQDLVPEATEDLAVIPLSVVI